MEPTHPATTQSQEESTAVTPERVDDVPVSLVTPMSPTLESAVASWSRHAPQPLQPVSLYPTPEVEREMKPPTEPEVSEEQEPFGTFEEVAPAEESAEVVEETRPVPPESPSTEKELKLTKLMAPIEILTQMGSYAHGFREILLRTYPIGVKFLNLLTAEAEAEWKRTWAKFGMTDYPIDEASGIPVAVPIIPLICGQPIPSVVYTHRRNAVAHLRRTGGIPLRVDHCWKVLPLISYSGLSPDLASWLYLLFNKMFPQTATFSTFAPRSGLGESRNSVLRGLVRKLHGKAMENLCKIMGACESDLRLFPLVLTPEEQAEQFAEGILHWWQSKHVPSDAMGVENECPSVGPWKMQAKALWTHQQTANLSKAIPLLYTNSRKEQQRFAMMHKCVPLEAKPSFAVMPALDFTGLDRDALLDLTKSIAHDLQVHDPAGFFVRCEVDYERQNPQPSNVVLGVEEMFEVDKEGDEPRQEPELEHTTESVPVPESELDPPPVTRATISALPSHPQTASQRSENANVMSRAAQLLAEMEDLGAEVPKVPQGEEVVGVRSVEQLAEMEDEVRLLGAQELEEQKPKVQQPSPEMHTQPAVTEPELVEPTVTEPWRSWNPFAWILVFLSGFLPWPWWNKQQATEQPKKRASGGREMDREGLRRNVDVRTRGVSAKSGSRFPWILKKERDKTDRMEMRTKVAVPPQKQPGWLRWILGKLFRFVLVLIAIHTAIRMLQDYVNRNTMVYDFHDGGSIHFKFPLLYGEPYTLIYDYFLRDGQVVHGQVGYHDFF